MKLILKWLNILYVSSGKAIKLSVQKVHTGQSHIISAANNSPRSEKVVYGRIELDYHADTTVTGANWFILKYTGKQCEVLPYHDDYEAIKVIPLVHVSTACK